MTEKYIDVSKQPSESQMEMLKRAADKPIVYDEDSPKLDEEDLKKFKRIFEVK